MLENDEEKKRMDYTKNMDNTIELLTPKSKTFYLDKKATIRQALEKFDFHKFSVVSVIDEQGHFVSTISEGDILRFIKNECHFDIHVAENITIDKVNRYRPYVAINIAAPKEEIFSLSLSQNFVPVVDDRGIFIGIITRSSILKLYLNQ